MDRGKIDALVKGAVVHRAVSEERHHHVALSAHLGADSGPHRGGQTAADNAVGAEQADGGIKQVHAPAPSAAAAGGLAIEFGHEVPGRQSLRQGMSVPAVSAGNPVLFAQAGAHSHCGRLLAHVQMNEAGHPAGLIVLLRCQLELPEQNHLLVQPQALRLVRKGMGRFHVRRFFY